jgi:hypothetical protein
MHRRREFLVLGGLILARPIFFFDITDGAAQRKRVKKKKAAKQLPGNPDGTAAGHTYDYFRDRWDKFDVDAALAEADEDTEYETDDEDKALKPAPQVCMPLGRYVHACISIKTWSRARATL